MYGATGEDDAIPEKPVPNVFVAAGLESPSPSPPPDYYSAQSVQKDLKPEYQDKWAAAVFLVLASLVIIFGIVGMAVVKRTDYSSTPSSHPSLPTWMFIAVLLSTVLGLLWIGLLCKFAYIFIWAANGFQIVGCIIMAIVCFAKHSAGGGILLLLVAAMNSIWLFLVRERIQFASVLLEQSAKVLLENWGTMVVALGFLGANVLIAIFWLFAILFFWVKASSWLLLPGLFFILWMSQVCMNCTHVTTSGVVATWWMGGTGGTANQVSAPTLPALRRTCTWSFGSVCFGSLLVALVKLVHTLCRSLISETHSIVAIAMSCIVQLLERALEWFNTYAFVHVAVYGHGYLQSAKDTFTLLVNSGIWALINDSLIHPLLTFLAIGSGLFVGAIIGMADYVRYAGDVDGAVHPWVVFFVGVITSIVVLNVLLALPHSAVVTLFVCYAEQPDAIRNNNPALYEKLTHAATTTTPLQKK